MKKHLKLICDPFEEGHSGISRYIGSLFETISKTFSPTEYEIGVLSQDERFWQLHPTAKEFGKTQATILTHFLCERRVWRVPAPFVITCHDLTPQIAPYRYGILRALYHKIYVNYFLRRADAIICPSLATKRELMARAGVREENIFVIRHGFQSQVFFADSDPPFDLLMQKKINRNYILLVSRLEHPGKNLVFAIQSYNRLREKNTEKVDLVLVGAFWSGHETILAEISRSPYANDIHVLGQQTDDCLRKLYSSARFLFFVGLREGFALPVLESLACSTPVLLPDIDVLREFRESGLVFYNPHSTEACAAEMEKLLVDDTTRKNIKIDRYFWSWERVAAEVKAVYDPLFTR